MKFIAQGHEYINEIQTVTQIFFPNEGFVKAEDLNENGFVAVSRLDKSVCVSNLYENSQKLGEYAQPVDGDVKTAVKRCMYLLLKSVTNPVKPWGMLTGIRPTKLVHELFDAGYADDAIHAELSGKYDITNAKLNLLLSVAKRERKILYSGGSQTASLYVGIPFCPTKCLYCSFTSYPVKKHAKQVTPYTDALVKELDAMSVQLNRYEINSVYIGGGTPTALDPINFERVLKAAAKFNKQGEFTVEAGRPDTIDRDKLLIMKKYGVNRISINCQTMNDKTLAAIGRSHSAEEFTKAYETARELGFCNINIDLIVGLVGEGMVEIKHTLDEITKLEPESVTVHTLTVKRASRLNENLDIYDLTEADKINAYLGLCREKLDSIGLKPYYLYRQKNTLGNFENVGYSKPGKECAYNVHIMGERQTIFAAGAGAVTKYVNLDTKHIERVFNVKSVEDYIGRIDEMIMRKDDAHAFRNQPHHADSE